MADYRTNAQVTVVQGSVGTGKTQRLIDRAHELVAQGARPSDLLIVATSPLAVQALRKRLDIPGSTVTTARALARSVLSEPTAIAFTGRPPRLPFKFEEDFILEDVKTCGIQPNKLRRMLAYFRRRFTELLDEDIDSWLVTKEEEKLLDAVMAALRGNGCMLECEMANRAVQYLRAADASSPSWQHVLVDDYQDLSCASQVLCGTVARETLWVASDPAGSVEAYDSFPYAEGAVQLAKANPDCTVETLMQRTVSEQVRSVVDPLLSDTCFDNVRDSLPAPVAQRAQGFELKTATAAKEFAAVAELVARALADGVRPHDVAVVSTSTVWRKGARHALEVAGIPASEPVKPDIGDDLRSFDRCREARVLALLQLVTDSEAPTGWRAWCGFGDYLANSALLGTLERKAQASGTSLRDEIAALANAPAPASSLEAAERERVANAYTEAVRAFAAAQERRGEDLLDALSRAVGEEDGASSQLRALCEPQPNDDAKALLNRAREKHFGYDLRPLENDAVRVLDPHDMAGLSFDTVIWCGLADGIFPRADYFDLTKMDSSKRERVHLEDLRLAASTFGKARNRAVGTCAEHIGLVDAERLGLRVHHIKLAGGKRIADTYPSEILHIARGNGREQLTV